MSKTKIIANNISESSYTQKFLFSILICGIILIGLIYVYIIGSITFNVLARKSLESTVKIANSNISQLELTYLNKVNQIDKEYALSHGFVEIQNNIFATRSINRVAIR